MILEGLSPRYFEKGRRQYLWIHSTILLRHLNNMNMPFFFLKQRYTLVSLSQQWKADESIVSIPLGEIRFWPSISSRLMQWILMFQFNEISPHNLLSTIHTKCIRKFNTHHKSVYNHGYLPRIGNLGYSSYSIKIFSKEIICIINAHTGS